MIINYLIRKILINPHNSGIINYYPAICVIYNKKFLSYNNYYGYNGLYRRNS
jgi:hypothetical protein